MVDFCRIILFFLLVNFSFAQTNYYVDNNLGTDNISNGSTPGTAAWKTIEYAINKVSNPSTDGIIINISSGTYDLSNNQIEINRNFLNLTLLGDVNNGTIIQSASDITSSNSRIFQINSGNVVKLQKLTLRYGKSLLNGGAVLNNGGTLNIDFCRITENLCTSTGFGAGICNLNGNLTVSNSIINNNTAFNSCYGGGIGSLNGSVELFNSTISHNSSPGGGGVAIVSSGADANFNIYNSTVTENTATYFCGAIRLSIFGSDNFKVTSNINSCTIFNNTSTGVKGVGGIGNLSQTDLFIKNSIIAGNNAVIDKDIFGKIVSEDYNLIQTVGNAIILGVADNNIYGLSPNCSTLADNNTLNGTQTCSITDNSPAKDQIPSSNPNGAPLLDQRGYQRDGNYDIGAYEVSNFTDVEVLEELVTDYKLEQNYPNPFNPSTTIKFYLPKAENVNLSVYNLLGQKVSTLINEFKEAGSHAVNFKSKNFNSGIYFYKIETAGFTQIKKMTLIK